MDARRGSGVSIPATQSQGWIIFSYHWEWIFD